MGSLCNIRYVRNRRGWRVLQRCTGKSGCWQPARLDVLQIIAGSAIESARLRASLARCARSPRAADRFFERRWRAPRQYALAAALRCADVSPSLARANRGADAPPSPRPRARRCLARVARAQRRRRGADALGFALSRLGTAARATPAAPSRAFPDRLRRVSSALLEQSAKNCARPPPRCPAIARRNRHARRDAAVGRAGAANGGGRPR